MNAPELMRAAFTARCRGNFSHAIGLYESALSIDPYLAPAYRALADLSRQDNYALLERAINALKAHGPHSAEAAILSFAIAKCCDDLESYELSWKWLTSANQIQRRLLTYDVNFDLRTMRQLAAAWGNPVDNGHRSDSLYPIFIIGVPRCGSTVLERILSAHPRIRSIGESPVIPDCVKELATWSDYLDGPSFDINPGDLRAQYLQRIPAAPHPMPLPLRWVDKQLLNFCYVPLIARAFPQARFLHIHRHPLAALYGIYRQRFPGTWQFAYDLEEISAFCAGYRELMRQWSLTLNAGSILELDLELLTSHFEMTVRQVLEFVGVEFDAQCLKPEANPAPVLTMSSVQARAPVGAVRSTWEQYRRYLEPYEPA